MRVQGLETMGCGPSSVARDPDELDRSRHPTSQDNSRTARLDGFPCLEYAQTVRSTTVNGD